MTSFPIFLIFGSVIVAALLMSQLIRKFINPRKNGYSLLLYFLLHLAGIFVISFLVNWVMIYLSK